MRLMLIAAISNILAVGTCGQLSEHLQGRSCVYNGCACDVGTPQGQYCGCALPYITNFGNGGGMYDIYECNPSGGCCDYGWSDVCAAEGTCTG